MSTKSSHALALIIGAMATAAALIAHDAYKPPVVQLPPSHPNNPAHMIYEQVRVSGVRK